MKKMIAAFAAVLTLGTLPVTAYAREGVQEQASEAISADLQAAYEEAALYGIPEVYEYTSEETELAFPGRWVTTGYGFDLYLPGEWAIADFASQDEMGYSWLATDGVHGVMLMVKPVPGISDISSIYALYDDFLSQDSEAAAVEINGIYGFLLTLNGQDAVCVSMIGPQDNLYMLTFFPDSDESMTDTFAAIISSIRNSQ